MSADATIRGLRIELDHARRECAAAHAVADNTRLPDAEREKARSRLHKHEAIAAQALASIRRLSSHRDWSLHHYGVARQ